MNVDVLHQKLLTLDSALRESDHKDKNKVENVLHIFLRNKALGNVGRLVVSLMSSREEALLLERERKFMKAAEKGEGGKISKTTKVESTGAPSFPGVMPFSSPQHAMFPGLPFSAPQMWQGQNMSGQGWGFPSMGHRPPRRGFGQRPAGGKPRCFACGEEGHFARECKNK